MVISESIILDHMGEWYRYDIDQAVLDLNQGANGRSKAFQPQSSLPLPTPKKPRDAQKRVAAIIVEVPVLICGCLTTLRN